MTFCSKDNGRGEAGTLPLSDGGECTYDPSPTTPVQLRRTIEVPFADQLIILRVSPDFRSLDGHTSQGEKVG